MQSDLRVAVVTGAARGIGLATARLFLERGHRAVLLDIYGDNLARAAHELSTAFPGSAPDAQRVLPVECDVADATRVSAAFRRIDETFGRIDALVNNAGIAIFKPILETSFDEWSRVLAVNLGGPFLCTQAAATIMLRGEGGAVVNITSISGIRASTLRVAYGTSKAALAHLTRQQAVELGARGIRVNAVAPGPVDTAMAKQVHTPEIRADYHAAIPLNRYGSEREIAETVFFLCSPAAAYVNGQVLAADGGFEAAGIGLTTLRDAAV